MAIFLAICKSLNFNFEMGMELRFTRRNMGFPVECRAGTHRLIINMLGICKNLALLVSVKECQKFNTL